MVIAQDKIEYRTVVDNPDLVPDNYLFLYYFDYEASLLSDQDERHSAVASLGASINGIYKVSDKLKADAYFKYAYFGDVKEVKKFPVKLDLGVSYLVSNKRKNKDVKVNVSSYTTTVEVKDDNGKTLGWTDAVGVNQIMVPGTYKLETGLRGGLSYQNGTYDRGSNGLGTYRTLAASIGIVRESKVHLVAELRDGHRISAQYLRMYFDLNFYPLASSSINTIGKVSRLGFKAGAQGSLPGMRNFMNYMTPKVEIGYHALNGSYFQIGLGLDLFGF